MKIYDARISSHFEPMCVSGNGVKEEYSSTFVRVTVRPRMCLTNHRSSSSSQQLTSVRYYSHTLKHCIWNFHPHPHIFCPLPSSLGARRHVDCNRISAGLQLHSFEHVTSGAGQSVPVCWSACTFRRALESLRKGAS